MQFAASTPGYLPKPKGPKQKSPSEGPRGAQKIFFFAFGLVSFALGFVGAFLPVLPTTPFMLVAVWAFSQSSVRLHRWLLGHKVFGPSLQRWQEHHVIPIHAKVLATTAILASLCYVSCTHDLPWYALLGMSLTMAAVLCFVLSRPSRAPSTSPEQLPITSTILPCPRPRPKTRQSCLFWIKDS